jgi:drug/metabolite transporter (DMT)-like permease
MKLPHLGSLWMLVAALLFAVMGALVKIGGEHFSSAELVFYRSFFGLVPILAMHRLQLSRFATPLLGRQLLRGGLGFLALMLFFYAIGALPLATAMTLNYTSPLFLALLLPFTLGERPRKRLVATVLLGFVGVVLLLRPSLHEGDFIAGAIGLLSGALAGFVYTQVAQLGRAGEPDWRTVFYFALISTLGAGVWMGLYGYRVPEWHDLPLLLGIGASATLAQLAMTRAYRTGNPLVVGSLAYTTVVLASLIGFALWHETLSLDRWLAIGLIVLSGILSIRITTPRSAGQSEKVGIG